jgi:hypothetical protein
VTMSRNCTSLSASWLPSGAAIKKECGRRDTELRDAADSALREFVLRD